MFQSLVESILSQQLAGAAASAITGRVKALFPGEVIEAAPLYTTPLRKLRKGRGLAAKNSLSERPVAACREGAAGS